MSQTTRATYAKEWDKLEFELDNLELCLAHNWTRYSVAQRIEMAQRMAAITTKLVRLTKIARKHGLC